MISSCSQQTNVSTAQEQKNLNSSVTGEAVSLDKKRATSDGKTPSVAKVVPFSHQPSVSAVKCSASTCCSSATPTVSAATNTHIQQSVAHEQNSMLQTSVDISESQCPAPDGGMMTVFAHFEDGQVRPIMRTICKEMQFKLTNPDLIKKSFLCYKKGVLFTMLSASQNTKRMKESKQYLTDHASDLDCQCPKWA